MLKKLDTMSSYLWKQAAIVMEVTAEELGQWFDAHAAALVLYARQWVDRGSAGGAEDLVQDVFVRLAGQSQKPTNVRAWLFASVRNAALDAIKTGRRRRMREQSGVLRRWFSEPMERGIEAGEIQGAMERLEAQEREIVILRIWGGATFEEIASVCAMPVSTVHVRYRQALDRLRQHWEVPCQKT